MRASETLRVSVRAAVSAALFSSATGVCARAHAQSAASPWAPPEQMLGALRVDAPVEGGAPLQVDGVEGSSIELREGASLDAPVRLRCVLPCATSAPVGPFYVHGRYLDERWSERVQFGPSGTRLRLRHPSNARYVGGIVLASFGAWSIALTYTMGVATFAMAPRDSYSGFIGGLAMVMGTVIGVPTLAGGIVLARNARVGIAAIESLVPSVRVSSVRVSPTVGYGSLGVTGSF